MPRKRAPSTAAITAHPAIQALRLDGEGGAAVITADPATLADNAPVWVRLDYAAPEAADWVHALPGIPRIAAETLLMAETRPRIVIEGRHLVLTLRGVNLNPGQNPEDMVSLRIWSDGRRLISTHHRPLMAERDLLEMLEAGHGPRDCGQLIAELASRLVQRMGPTVESLEERIDDLEMTLLDAEADEPPRDLADVRRTAIMLRRYLAPQSEVLAELRAQPPPWFDRVRRGALHHAADHTLRYVEDLGAIRERTAVIQEEINARIAAGVNRSVFRLTVVATVVLPLTLLAGLLGMNVGGIPGADHPWAFAIVVAAMAALAGVSLLFLKWMKWL